MASRNLIAEAQAQAAAQVAPQFAALHEALTQAKADRNAAIHTAAAASRGIGAAINRAGPSVKAAYNLKGLGLTNQSYSGGNYAAAAANEKAVTGTALASSLGNALKELSDRRIEAAAGRAYRSAAAEGNYQANVAKLDTRRQSLAAQQGLDAASAFSKLTEAAAGRKNQRLMQSRSLTSQANLQSDRLSSQANLQSQRLASSERVAGEHIAATNHNAALGRRQQKLGRIDKAKLAAAKPTKTNTALRTEIAQSFARVQDLAGTNKPAQIRHYLIEGLKTPNVTIPAAKNVEAVDVALALHFKKHISPEQAQSLESQGVQVPPQWVGVTVQTHTRKRPMTFKP